MFLTGNDPGDDDCVGLLPVVCGSLFINRVLQSLMIRILEKTSLSHFIGLSRMSSTAIPGVMSENILFGSERNIVSF